jgi:hypothetical protein
MDNVVAVNPQSDDERCAEAKKFERIDQAFRTGDLEALRAAVADASVIPNGEVHNTIGSCLVYAIYHSPLTFIRTLLEIGADPKAPVNDGFPPLIAALGCTRDAPGANRRDDVDEVIRLLLAFGGDPNQRGINDYTALHMAVAEGNAMAVQLLLEAGADPDLRTRIDECATPLEMARAAGLSAIAAMLERRGQPVRQRLRSGITLLLDIPGYGDLVQRQHTYKARVTMWLTDGKEVRSEMTELRINRGHLISGVFYGVDGMRVGGTRRLEIAPHMAYGDAGIPGMIPPAAALRVEITILAALPPWPVKASA